jgi:hypothetical protein
VGSAFQPWAAWLLMKCSAASRCASSVLKSESSPSVVDLRV